MKQLQCRLASLEEDGFGDLDLEPVGRESAVRERRRIVSWSEPRWNCTGETLTATRICSGQRAACAQASRTTQAPIGTIRPVSSATGMKSAGEISPRVGWFQRSRLRTSKYDCAQGRRGADSEARTRLVRSRVRRSASSCRRCCARSFRLSSKKAKVPRPASLARYRARSALRSSVSPSPPSCGAIAIPILVDGTNSLPSISSGWAIAFENVRASRSMALRSSPTV